MNKEPVDGEIEHFRSLDLEVEKHQHEQALAKIQADKEVALVAQRRRNMMARWTKLVATPILAISLLGSTSAAIVLAARSGPPESPEVAQIKAKQQRAKACADDKSSITSERRNIWWPDAEGGEGLCLPKEQAPPAK